MENIEQQLRVYVARNFLFRDEYNFTDDHSLMDSGIIDSTGILEVISMLEQCYGIKVEDTELVPENLDSITALARFVRTKIAAIPQVQSS